MAVTRLVRRLGHSFRKGRLNTLLLMIEALVRLPWAAVYRRVAFVPRRLQATETASTPSVLTSEQIERAGRVARVLFICQRRFPFRLNCLTLALAGERMLSRRGIASCVRIAVRLAPDGSELQSHAWLYAGQRIVTGGLPDPSYQPIWTRKLG